MEVPYKACLIIIKLQMKTDVKLVPHLVTGVNWTDLADVEVMEGHEQLSSQGAVVNVPCAQEERPQEL